MNAPGVVGPDPLPQKLGSTLQVIKVINNVGKGIHYNIGLVIEGSIAPQVSKGNITELDKVLLVPTVLVQIPVISK